MYTGLQSILNAALGDYSAKGFSLIEPDDHVLVLYHRGVEVAVFPQGQDIIQAIHRTCQKYLDLVGE